MGLGLFAAFPKHTAANPPDMHAESRSVTVVSLNTAKEPDAGKIVRDLGSAPRLRNADVFLMQEVANQEGRPSAADQVAHQLGYYVTFSPAAPGVYDQGLAIVSRFPIRDARVKRLKACDLRFRCRQRFAMEANLATPYGELKIWNAHLDTRINSEERVEQLAPVIDDAAHQNGPRLIGGDFNTNDLLWVKNMVPVPGGPSHGRAVRHAMEQRGFVTPFADGIVTFPVFRRHLDWIFVKQLTTIESSVEPAPFSDHCAIWTRVQMPNSN